MRKIIEEQEKADMVKAGSHAVAALPKTQARFDLRYGIRGVAALLRHIADARRRRATPVGSARLRDPSIRTTAEIYSHAVHG